MVYKSTELAEKFGYSPSQYKRWAREFLGTDTSDMRSGKSRKYSKEEAFKVYLAGYLITELLVPVTEVKNLLNDLTTWIKKNGLLQNQKQEVAEWQIFIREGRKKQKNNTYKTEYSCTAKGIVKQVKDKPLRKTKDGKEIWGGEEYFSERIRYEVMELMGNLKIFHPQVVVAGFSRKLGLSK